MRFLLLRPVITLACAAVYLRVRRPDEWRRRVAFYRDLNLDLARGERA